MFPERFAESTCLKCHHEVVDLQPSERFPDPPAPKLMAGYNLVREYGCFGCHDINGFDGPTRRIGPDLRVEPNYVAAAQQLLTAKGLTAEEVALAKNIIADPTNTADRQRLAQIITAEKTAGNGADANKPGGNDQQPRLSAASYKLVDLLGADDETPGQFRKVGPSLRYLKSKVDFDFVYDWIRNPRHFRPSTRMPRFFGLYDHLLPEGKEKKANGLKVAQKYEPIEIRALTKYLLDHSQPFEYIDVPKEVTEEASAERGKRLFEIRGCLACHKHPDFPNAESTRGPDLARLGDKLRSADSHRWLYTWLREPTSYHARTFMPNLFLTPIKETKEGKTTVTDPSADIAAFLIGKSEDVEPYQPGPAEELDTEALDELVMLSLKKVFTEVQANEYLQQGIPEDLAGEIKGDEATLIGPASTEKKLDYISRRALNKYGCFGCHDVPGYEIAKPIGTGLADWGRKQPDRLAFEQISGLIDHLQHHGDGHGGSHAANVTQMDNLQDAQPASLAAQAAMLQEYDRSGYFVYSLLSHERQGFLWKSFAPCAATTT